MQHPCIKDRKWVSQRLVWHNYGFVLLLYLFLFELMIAASHCAQSVFIVNCFTVLINEGIEFTKCTFEP